MEHWFNYDNTFRGFWLLYGMVKAEGRVGLLGRILSFAIGLQLHLYYGRALYMDVLQADLIFLFSAKNHLSGLAQAKNTSDYEFFIMIQDANLFCFRQSDYNRTIRCHRILFLDE